MIMPVVVVSAEALSVLIFEKKATTDLGGVRCDRRGLQLLSDLQWHTLGTVVLRQACAF